MMPRFRVTFGIVLVVGVAAIGLSCSPAASGRASLELVPADSIGYLSFSIEEGSDPSPLRDSSEYQAAVDLLGDDFAPGIYLNFETVLTFAEAVGASSSLEYEEDVKPWLDPLTHMIFGSKIEGDTIIQKYAIGVE